MILLGCIRGRLTSEYFLTVAGVTVKGTTTCRRRRMENGNLGHNSGKELRATNGKSKTT